MLDLVVNATVTDTSASFAGVTASGTGLTAPASSEWTVVDAETSGGDMLEFDVLAYHAPPSGYRLEAIEVAIEESGAATRTQLLPFGLWTGKKSLVRMNASTNITRVRIREAFHERNSFEWGGSAFNSDVPQVGDSVVFENGATATIKATTGNIAIVENISGDAAANEGPTSVTIGGTVGRQEGLLVPTASLGERVVTYSEWSDPVTITPSSGVPSVSITANKTTCLQGEAVLLEAVPTGFDCEYPMQDLHFHWTVDATEYPDEQGPFTALDGSVWESEFGAGQNNRCEGFSFQWAFAPKTTGSIDVDVTVRDRSGNVVTQTITLTSVAPLSSFAASDIYAVSATSRTVPGIDNGTITKSTDLSTVISALPALGEALILLDTTGTHGLAQDAVASFTGKAGTRIAIMPYSDSGVGYSAGARATTVFRIQSDSDTFIAQGLNVSGGFTALDPYSVAGLNGSGFALFSVGTHASVADCKSLGWDTCFRQPDIPASYTLYDFEATEFSDWATFSSDHGQHVLAGCNLYHDPESWQVGVYSPSWSVQSKTVTTAPLQPDHTAYRCSRPDGKRAISKTRMFSSVGHSTPSQPALRPWGGAHEFPHSFHLSELLLEERGGPGGIYFGSTSATTPNFNGIQDICLDKIKIIIEGGVRTAFSLGVAPATVRNLSFVKEDRASDFGGAGSALFFLSPQWATHTSYNNGSMEARYVFEACSGINLMSTATTNASSEFALIAYDTKWPASHYPNVVTRNNLVYSPNLADSEDSGPVNTTARYTPTFQAQYRFDDEAGGLYTARDDTFAAEKLTWNLDPANGSIDSSFAVTNVVSATYEPQSGSSAYQTATGSIPYDDILSRVRPTDGTASKGAYDPGGT